MKPYEGVELELHSFSTFDTEEWLYRLRYWGS